MNPIQIWNHYPPQHLLVLPQPRLRLEAAPFFCRPQWLVSTVNGQVVSLAFFVALHLPSQPGVLHIESLHLFVEQPAVIQAISCQWQQLSRLTGCHHLQLCSVVLDGENLFYPTTGFYTSPCNPPFNVAHWLPPSQQKPVQQSYIWRLSEPQGANHPQGVQVLDIQSAHPPWPWYSVGQRLRVATLPGEPPLICRIFVNLYPALQRYGRMPELLQWGDWPASECRLHLESPDMNWDPTTLGAIVGYLNQHGYQQYEIMTPDPASWLANEPWHGRVQAEVCEWEIDACLVQGNLNL